MQKWTKKEISRQYDMKSKNTEKEPRLAEKFSHVALEEEAVAVLQPRWQMKMIKSLIVIQKWQHD